MWTMKIALKHARYHKRQARRTWEDLDHLQTASGTFLYLSQWPICGLVSSKGYLHHHSFLIVAVRVCVLIVVFLVFRRRNLLRLPCSALRGASLA